MGTAIVDYLKESRELEGNTEWDIVKLKREELKAFFVPTVSFKSATVSSPIFMLTKKKRDGRKSISARMIMISVKDSFRVKLREYASQILEILGEDEIWCYEWNLK